MSHLGPASAQNGDPAEVSRPRLAREPQREHRFGSPRAGLGPKRCPRRRSQAKVSPGTSAGAPVWITSGRPRPKTVPPPKVPSQGWPGNLSGSTCVDHLGPASAQNGAPRAWLRLSPGQLWQQPWKRRWAGPEIALGVLTPGVRRHPWRQPCVTPGREGLS